MNDYTYNFKSIRKNKVNSPFSNRTYGTGLKTMIAYANNIDSKSPYKILEKNNESDAQFFRTSKSIIIKKALNIAESHRITYESRDIFPIALTYFILAHDFYSKKTEHQTTAFRYIKELINYIILLEGNKEKRENVFQWWRNYKDILLNLKNDRKIIYDYYLHELIDKHYSRSKIYPLEPTYAKVTLENFNDNSISSEISNDLNQYLHDLLKDNGELIYDQFFSLKNDILNNKNTNNIIKTINDLQLVFYYAQKQSKTSKNIEDSEIFDDIQKLLFDLVFYVRYGKKDKIDEYFAEILDVLKVLVETNEEIEEVNKELDLDKDYELEIEPTDIKFGDYEVYKVK